jgi:hypothetical protein
MSNYTGWPMCISNCSDCGVGTFSIGEYYMVKNEVWEQAWSSQRKSYHGKVPGQEVLCIGCLETRIGRTLCGDDFTFASNANISDRLRDRLQHPRARSPR